MTIKRHTNENGGIYSAVTKEQIINAITKLIFLVLITLRACDIIDWAWYLILSPYFAGITITIIFSIHKDIKKRRQKKIDAAVSALIDSRNRGEAVTFLGSFSTNEFYEIMQKVNKEAHGENNTEEN